MEVLFTLLKAKGFAVSESKKITEVSTHSAEDLASFLTACRENPSFDDYKLCSAGESLVVAVDYDYTGRWQEMLNYANALIKDTIMERSRGRSVKAGSLDLAVVGGKLCLQYESFSPMAGHVNHDDPIGEVEEKIIQYALKVLPDATHPKQA